MKIWRARVTWVLVMMFGLSFGSARRAESMDMKQMAGLAGVGTIAISSMAGYDFSSSISHCSCFTATPPCPPKNGWSHCLMTPLNAAALGAALWAIMANDQSKGATNAGGVGSIPNFNPNLPLVNQLNPQCEANPADCGCTPENSAGNPVCDPEAFKNLGDIAERFRKDVQDGKIVSSDGKDLTEDLAKMDLALGQIAAVTTGSGGSEVPDSGEIAGGALGFGEASGARSGRGTAYSTSFQTQGSGGVGTGGGRVGPANTEGLGNAIPLNGLTMIDEATGKELTLWQRATRRYQGEQGSRALRLARVEFTRQEVKARKLALEKQFQDQSRRDRQNALVRAAHQDSTVASAARRKAIPAIQPPKKPQRLERN